MQRIVSRPLRNDKDVGSNPAADIGDPLQKVAQWSTWKTGNVKPN